jgi:hypothetical protein
VNRRLTEAWRTETRWEIWFAMPTNSPVARAQATAYRIRKQRGLVVSRSALEEHALDIDLLAARARIAAVRGHGRVAWMLLRGRP